MSKKLIENIRALNREVKLSKHEQIVKGILKTIDDGDLRENDQLPSINKMVEEIGYARKTIVHAYEDLKGRGLVLSKSFKGYFIANTDTNQKLKVALILYAFHSFQEVFYETFRKQLNDNIHLDVFFHHNSQETFEKILLDAEKEYGMLVVAPIQNKIAEEVLKQIALKNF